jgi:hypothetical protein
MLNSRRRLIAALARDDNPVTANVNAIATRWATELASLKRQDHR